MFGQREKLNIRREIVWWVRVAHVIQVNDAQSESEENPKEKSDASSIRGEIVGQ